MIKSLELSLNLDCISNVFCLTASLLDILVGIAKTSASLLAMVAVVTQTQPAEFVATLTTRHVHAARILLDGSLALWTWLCIQLNPVVRVTLTLINSVLPCLQKVTINWHVCLLGAAEAGDVATVTLNVDGQGIFLLDYLVTVQARTPLPLLDDVNIGIDQIHLVLRVAFLVQELLKNTWWDDISALNIGTLCKDAVWSIRELRLSMSLEAVNT